MISSGSNTRKPIGLFRFSISVTSNRFEIALYYIWHEKGWIVPMFPKFFEIFWKNLGMKRMEKIWVNYTRKMWINLLLPRMGKKITGTRLSPNTRYLVYQPRLTDAIIVISWITFLWAPARGADFLFCRQSQFIIAQEMTKLRLTVMQFTGIL